MLLEALVVATCISGKQGCSQASSAYYKSNKELQAIVKNTEKSGKKMLEGNEYIIYAATPIYAILAKQKASFKLYRGVMLNVDVKDQTIGVVWSF